MTNRMRPRVGVDVDGVLADLLTPLYALASRLYGVDLSDLHKDTWDLDKLLPPGKADEFWKAAGEEGSHDRLDVYPGAVKGVAALQEVADVYIVTSYLHDARTWVYERDRWIQRHFGIPRRKMVHTHAKYTFSGDMLIDDKPENIELWAQDRIRARDLAAVPVLWAHRYNAAHLFPGPVAMRVVRTNDWAEAVRRVQGIDRGAHP
jgi:5'(3')-deoxyribonucleotidase